jgi:hypothetical protein
MGIPVISEKKVGLQGALRPHLRRRSAKRLRQCESDLAFG